MTQATISRNQQGFLQRFLDPIDRLTEAIYAVLIVMTFTMAYRAIEFDAMSTKLASEALTQLALAAFGCAFAWGIIDGMMFILLSMLERGEGSRLLKRVRAAPNEQTGMDVIAAHFDGTLETMMSDTERKDIYRQAYQRMRDNEPQLVGFKREEFLGALGVILIAMAVALPVVMPLILFQNDVNLALRASNLMAILMLFLFGYQWGKYAGSNRIKVGLLLASLGFVMVFIAIPLGG